MLSLGTGFKVCTTMDFENWEKDKTESGTDDKSDLGTSWDRDEQSRDGGV